ncbi:hypothetical protein T4E_7477 [Trichinella pseudospiralis]|uniref:Uncharacterized protein n=1 Tax=Trichinella pseudospiralis TaxID=6337 RepID=A0A0V0X7C6_TRIPS|nr:hypothetical protein T4E_5435 [Trichinella pseudospiralis]KRX85805.1 hypothetical protein T4E_7477 [Trichinella pseudospiralis]
MPCLILSTLQPFTSQNDVLYRSLPPENVFAHESRSSSLEESSASWTKFRTSKKRQKVCTAVEAEQQKTVEQPCIVEGTKTV